MFLQFLLSKLVMSSFRNVRESNSPTPEESSGCKGLGKPSDSPFIISNHKTELFPGGDRIGLDLLVRQTMQKQQKIQNYSHKWWWRMVIYHGKMWKKQKKQIQEYLRLPKKSKLGEYPE